MSNAFTTLLQRQADAAESAVPTPDRSPTSATLARVIERPPTYDGKDRAACATFLNQIRQYFRTNPTLFSTDDEKIDFTVSYLRGKAFRFVEPHLEKRDADIFGDFSVFCEKLIANLGDPDLERTSEKALRNLAQTGSVAAYSTEFFRLAGFVKWNDEALQSQFRSGLKSEIKRALIYSTPTVSSTKALSEAAIRLDNGLFEIDQENRKPSRSDIRSDNRRSAVSPTTSATSTPTSARSTAPPTADSMDVDAARTSRRFQPLTPEQREHRMKHRLCLYCGEPGHLVGNCPTRNQRQLRVTLSAETDADNADSKN